MKHRDIDFHIYTSSLSLADSFRAMAKLAENTSVKKIECVNLLHTVEACVEWHAWYQDSDNALKCAFYALYSEVRWFHQLGEGSHPFMWTLAKRLKRQMKRFSLG